MEPTPVTLAAIREVLGCPWNDLLGGTDAIWRDGFDAGYKQAREDALGAVRGIAALGERPKPASPLADTA